MLCEISFSLDGFIGVLLGGVIALISSIIIQKFQFKKDRAMWRDDRRLKLFADLIGILDSIDMQMEFDSNEGCSDFEMKIDVEHVKHLLHEFLNFIENNRGMLLIFLPKGINGDLVKLSGEIYSITTDLQKQIVEITDIRKSNMFKVIVKAKNIANDLRKEINR